jgi:lysophospholipase L1-like esterase
LPGGRKSILFIGDSLIEFYDWEGRFPAHRVWSLGVSGETVEGLLGRLGRITSEHERADMVFIMSGINNVSMEDPGFIRAYGEIIERLKASYPGVRIYVNSLLPNLFPFIPQKAVAAANAELRSLAEETGATYLNVHKAFVEGNLAKLLSTDGIHLSEKGYELWSHILEGIIEG